jgi:hypothetical protein
MASSSIADYLTERFVIVRPAEVRAERLQELAFRGVRSINRSVVSMDLKAQIRTKPRIVGEVFPRVP